MKLTIIVPVFNEALLLERFWDGLCRAPIDKCRGISDVEVLVYDDGSTDSSVEVLQKLMSQPMVFAGGISAVTKLTPSKQNKGKGYCIRTGIQESTGDVILIQDSDMEYSPNDYPELLAPLVQNNADVVYGTRFFGFPRRVHLFWHAVGNRFLNFLSNIVNNTTISDLETGLKAFRGDLARSLRLTSNRFGIEPELTARAAKAGARIYEVAASYRGRSYNEGKKVRAIDGVAAIFHILRFGLLDTEPYLPGLNQTLTALDKVGKKIYAPILISAMKKAGGSRKKSLRILEIGAGIGTLTGELLRFGEVVATDISETFLSKIRWRYSQYASLSALAWDATKRPWDMGQSFDVIVCFNVLEHIQDDAAALKSWRDMLNPGGKLILLVPNHPKLFSNLDKAAGHFRRYSHALLRSKLGEAGLDITNVTFANPLGIFGWILHGKIFGKNTLPLGQLRFYSLAKSALWPVENILAKATGLSIVVVAENYQLGRS